MHESTNDQEKMDKAVGKGRCARGVCSRGRNPSSEQGGDWYSSKQQSQPDTAMFHVEATHLLYCWTFKLFRPIITIAALCTVFIYLFVNLFNPRNNPVRQDFTDENIEGPRGEGSCLSHEAGSGVPSVGSTHLSWHGQHVGGLLKQRSWGPTPPELEAVALGEASAFAFLTGSQAVRILVTGATFEDPLL